MIEIIAFVWCTSFLLSTLLTAWNVISPIRFAKSSKYLIMNSNLGKIGLYWSLSSETFQKIAESNPDDDLKKVTRSSLLMGLLGLLSFPGFLLLLIVTVSMRVLIKSRLAEHAFSSDLAKVTNLDSQAVQAIVNSLPSR